jgi:hypothetical protein
MAEPTPASAPLLSVRGLTRGYDEPVAVASGLVLWVGYDRPVSAALSFGTAVVVGEAILNGLKVVG